jgi:cytosol alanyl aminopeptidase
MKRAASSFAVLGLCAFGAAVVQAAEPVPPTLRLPETVRPLRQEVMLRIDPNQETFTGSVDIALDLRAATAVVWLNAAAELDVTTWRLTVAGKEVPARVIKGTGSFLGLALPAPIGPGLAALHLDYKGPVSRKDNEGVFAANEGGDWYAFTQFEPIAARRAFPCFDEPGYKIPWKVTLRVPKGLTALSNTPVASTRDEADGTTSVMFAETKPLPSYLVAVAVGPFDIALAGTSGRNQTVVRIVVPRGRGKDARFAVESTVRILALLEDYFDRPYPYEKLDQVAIPGVGFAMEHPGLVTYGQSLMVQRPAEETITTKREYASVCAHELAHMWFGDLVTTSWWDDIWLNEAFASWMGEKITDRFRPDWDVKVSRVTSRSDALWSDSLASARRIRQPIESEHDIQNAFDGITYIKGEAVIEMFEAWLGEEVFRKGVQAHLDAHAWGNATADDFLTSLSKAAGRDVKTPFSSFLDQSGAPVVTAEVRCDGAPKVILSQKPYGRLGSPAVDKAWQVPVCLKGAGGAPLCTLLNARTTDVALGAACPEWTFANAGMAGYFRVGVTGAQIERVLRGDRLSVPEKVGLLGDARALVSSGDLAAADALALAATAAADSSRHVLAASWAVVESVKSHVPEAFYPRYAAFVRDLYGARARALGWKALPTDDEDTRLLRETLVLAVGGPGEDPALGQQAVALAERWLDDPRAVDPDMVDAVLTLAARHGGRALYDRLAVEVVKATDRDRRGQILEGLGSFRDPALVRAALGLSLQDGLDPRESIGIVIRVSRDPRTQPLAYQFAKDNKAALQRRLPRDFGAYLPMVGRGNCTPEGKADVVAAFKPEADQFPGGPRILDQVVETLDLCIAERKVVGPSLSAFLEKR